MILILREDPSPSHMMVRVFAGKHEGATGFCGELTMRNDEYAELCRALGRDGVEPPHSRDGRRIFQFMPPSRLYEQEAAGG